jgi:hypothetical protein
MKKNKLALFLVFALANLLCNAQSKNSAKQDSLSEATRNAINEVIARQVLGEFDSIFAGKPDKSYYFTIRFKIAGYDSVSDYVTSLYNPMLTEAIVIALNKSLAIMKAAKLDYKVFEETTILIQIAVLGERATDTSINNLYPIERLPMLHYILFDKYSKPAKNVKPVFKAYQLLPVVWPERRVCFKAD